MHGNWFFDRVVRVRASCDNPLLAIVHRRARAKIKRSASGISGRNIQTLRRRAKQSEPTLGFDFQVYSLRMIEIVAHDYRQRNLVALGENSRRIVFDKERLKRLDLFLDGSKLSVFSRTDHRHLPRRDVVGEFEFQLGASLLVCLQRRLPDKRFGKVFAKAWGGKLINYRANTSAVFRAKFKIIRRSRFSNDVDSTWRK